MIDRYTRIIYYTQKEESIFCHYILVDKGFHNVLNILIQIVLLKHSKFRNTFKIRLIYCHETRGLST